MYKCEVCAFETDRVQNFSRHMTSNRHKNLQESASQFIIYRETTGPVYHCNSCSYNTQKLFSIKRHVGSGKHVSELVESSTSTSNSLIDTVMAQNDAVMAQNTEMLAQTSEMMSIMKLVIEKLPTAQDKALTIQNSNNTITQTKKQKFNLNFYLNEECKNAMNLSDFVRSVVITLEDLDHIGEVGYAEGMANIITRALQEQGHADRPMHCNDVKRETMYVKENDTWHKDIQCQETLKAIEHIANKNYKALKEWCLQHPEHHVPDSPDNDAWYNISRTMSSGSTSETAKKKILHWLAEATSIEKELSGND